MNKKFMRKAIALSINNVKENKGGPFGAVVVKDGEIMVSIKTLLLLTPAIFIILLNSSLDFLLVSLER